MSEHLCLFCDEPLGADLVSKVGLSHEDGGPHRVFTPEGVRYVHDECSLRMVIGGIGHLRDHAFWCRRVGDPDGGLSYRQSSLAVAAWVREHGIDAAINTPTD